MKIAAMIAVGILAPISMVAFLALVFFWAVPFRSWSVKVC